MLAEAGCDNVDAGMWGVKTLTRPPPVPAASLSHLDVLHMLKEVRLGVVVVRQLDEVPELFSGGEGLDEAGQHRGVIVLHALEEPKSTS